MNAKKEFAGKTALITGSARGIGFSIAEDMAEWGADIVIMDINQENCDKSAADISSRFGVKATGIQCNITDKTEVESAAKKIKSEQKGLNFLINNAGIIKDNLLLRMKEEEWDAVLDVNLKGAFLVTQALLPLLMKAEGGGRIVNLSSISGILGQAGQANYSASKAGLIGFTRVVAREYASRGILANAVCPGYVKTDMTASLPDKTKELMNQSIPLGRPAEVKDISQVVRFLCSAAASYITGNVIRIDGGIGIGA